jgi:hypothetical protein
LPRSRLVALSAAALTLAIAVFGLASSAFAITSAAPASTVRASYLHRFHTITKVASTVPANGDVNPYGVAVVPTSMGALVAGDTLVSNFNSKANVQGTGTSIVQVSPSGSTSLFAQFSQLPAGMSCPGGIGLTTALGILPGGWVVVGSLPTAAGGALPGLNPVGCLIVLNDNGTPVESITNSDIVGPWDLAVSSTPTTAALFVSNALGGNTKVAGGVPVAGKCTVVRLDLSLSATAPPMLTSSTVIGSNYLWKANKAALILAPTGLALGSNSTLYVDNTQTNTISAIPNALTRTTAISASASVLSSGGALSAPLGMTIVANGDLIVVNGNNGNAVEVTPAGKQIAYMTLIKKGAGDLFGLTPSGAGNGILFVNDGSNTLELLHG